ncbi:16S rRNA (cytosine(967)-C(5))-methyltransferase RsmB [Methylophilaceae bacterium]|nr:16S rRNA (cytosine(967)-C(5))-methyltransferase RsmB [Methylophilaceae bacterium]|tara:strand:+ start:2363 stop:3640 length:1278 start_codon:yes stop_codon:yes gene_type:complete
MMSQSQLLAAKIVEQVLLGKNLDKSFQLVLKKYNNEEENLSQIKDMTYGAIRDLGKSNFYINSLVKNKIENLCLEALLHIVLFQINHSRSNDFTLVNQAVDAAKKIDHKKSSFINAVLRNFLRNKDSLQKQLKENQSAMFSYPNWWIEKVKKQYPKNWEDILNIGNQHPPLALRVNSKKIKIKDYSDTLRKQRIDHTLVSDECLIIRKPLDVNKIPGFLDGKVSVQDLGAQLAAHIIDLKENQKVLDACSAPGGKACHMLELNEIQLTAIESDNQRTLKINNNIKRQGFKAKVLNETINNQNEWWDKQYFDRILLDVPCSATGIVRRHVDIKWLRRINDFQNFADNQLFLLKAAWPMLKDGGKLLYVTCSIFEEENRGVIEKFKQGIDNVSEIDIVFPSNITHIKNQVLPSDNHDGLFYALLQKN